MIHNQFRIQDDDSITCGFYCIAFIEYMLAEKTSLDCTDLFSPNDYKNNDYKYQTGYKIIYKHFKEKYHK